MLLRFANDSRCCAFGRAQLRDDPRAKRTNGPTRVALNDRLEPIAAKAALAMCASKQRADLLAVLATHVDPSRREAILGLLAGFLDD